MTMGQKPPSKKEWRKAGFKLHLDMKASRFLDEHVKTV